MGGFINYMAQALVPKSQLTPIRTGLRSMVVEEGEAATDIDLEGQALVRGEFWRAISDEPIKEKEKVRVVVTKQMRVVVEKITQG